MKKMWLALVVFVMIVSIVPTAFAETGYGKGDYKVFSLGDSEELTKEKYEYLKNVGEITPTFLNKHTFFTSDIAGHEFNVFLFFYDDQLYKIYFISKDYSATGYDTYLKDLMMERIKPMFVGLNGEPTKDFGYPNFSAVKEGYIHYICKWALGDNKEIALGVSANDFEYSGQIIITDIKLEQGKEKEKEEAEKQKVLGSAADF